MISQDEIIAQIEEMQSENNTLHNEMNALYVEVKKLRNNYKTNNKILADLYKILPEKLNVVQRIFEEIEAEDKNNIDISLNCTTSFTKKH